MVRVSSFLRESDGSFTPLDRVVEAPADPDYIEGAIELVIDGVEIIGCSEWDYVDQLWAYVASMISALKSEIRASTYFPDQPVELIFEKKLPRVIVSANLGDSQWVADASIEEFLDSIRRSGRSFFELMSSLLPTRAAAYQVALRELGPADE